MELEISGHTYRTGKLNPMEQFQISRKLGPALLAYISGAGAAVNNAVAEGRGIEDISLLDIVGPVADILAKMSDADAEFVLTNCLAVCQRNVSGGWQVVYALGGGFMFNDLGIEVMYKLASLVVQENMGNFTVALSGMFPDITPAGPST